MPFGLVHQLLFQPFARRGRLATLFLRNPELVLKLGLLCSHPDPERRPGMRQVVQMLEHAVPPPEMSPEVISASMKQFEHHEAFDEFVGMSFPSTSEVTTATTRQFSNGSRPRSDFHSS